MKVSMKVSFTTITNDLEFPDGSNFVSQRVALSLDALIAWYESLLPCINALPNREEQRLKEKSSEVFRL